jgi:DNA-binding NarL/FixJ family response regulator
MHDDVSGIDLKVLIFDTDYYALQAMNSYLAWDRRTRVIHLAEKLADVWRFLETAHETELPDAVIFDIDHHTQAETLSAHLHRLAHVLHNAASHRHLRRQILCTLSELDGLQVATAQAILNSEATGLVLKGDIRLQIAWGLVFALDHDFVLTRSLVPFCQNLGHPRLARARVLPRQREYPDMSERVREAIKHTVIEGMPAHLAAHEMRLSQHTIRSYVREGYRIMESHDTTRYPQDMTPQEKAFMRFTAFEEDNTHTVG